MVATIGELLTPIEEEEESGSGLSRSTQVKRGKDEPKPIVKASVIKTSSR
jgi:26S proteasome regulatory subunit T5